MRDKGEFGSFLFSYSFSFHFLWPEKFFQPSHADLIYWSCPNNLKKKSSEGLWQAICLVFGLVLLNCCLSAVIVQADQSPVVAAPPVCVFERAGLYWERPSNSLMYQLVHSPPCCRPPGSVAPPSPSWELKVTGGKKTQHFFRIKMMDMLCLSKV